MFELQCAGLGGGGSDSSSGSGVGMQKKEPAWRFRFSLLSWPTHWTDAALSVFLPVAALRELLLRHFRVDVAVERDSAAKPTLVKSDSWSSCWWFFCKWFS